MKRASRAMAWTMTIATTLWLTVPATAVSAATYRYKWVSQTPAQVTSDGTAHYVNANAGDTVAMSVTLTNQSSGTIKGKTALGAIPAGKQVQVGAWSIGVRGDAATPWLDASSFVLNGNRFVYYDGADVAPGANFTVSWNVKIASTAANGTYNLYFRPVAEYIAWTQQVAWNGTILSQNKADIFTRFYIGGGAPVTPATGGLSVGIASGTPASSSLAAGASANFTKITLTPSAGATVSITQILVTRGALSADADVQNVKMLRASDGVQVGGTAGGFNALHKAQIFFSPALQISTPTDFYLRAGLVALAVLGNTVTLGINTNADIISNATSVTGAPIAGNPMTTIWLATGAIDITQFGSVTNSTPDVNDVNVIVNQFQLTAGATEDVWIEQISVLRTGTAAADDTVNIELWNDTANATVGTVASWTDNRATWNFNPPLKLGQGGNVRFTVRLDIIDGSGLTVNCDIVDGADVLVIARGDLYSYYLTPTNSGAWGGQGAAAQVINPGALTIAKSASSAPTGFIAIADSQTIGTWDFTVLGEDMRISALSIDLDGTIVEATQESNARIYDENGNIAAGPIDSSADGAVALDRELDFTQTFVAITGVHKYTLKLRIDAGTVDGNTLTTTITAAGDVTARGIRTNVAPVAVIGGAALNVQTVRAAALVVTTLTQPAVRSIVPNMRDFIFSTHSLDASGSGEDVLVTAARFNINITDTGADSVPTTVDTVQGATVWADLTAANSARGDVFETQLTNPTDPTSVVADADELINMPFTTTLTIAKGTFVKIAFVGNVPATLVATGNAADTVAVPLDVTNGGGVDNDVTAVGKDTGTNIDPIPVNAGAAAMIFAANGTLTVTIDSSSPLASILVGGAPKQKISVFRFAADNVENIEIDEGIFGLATTNWTGADDVAKWWAYSNRDGNGNLVAGEGVLLGTSASTSATQFTITVPDGTSTVPANGYALVTIYADVSSVDEVGVQNGDNIEVGADGANPDTEIDGTGRSSGAPINPVMGADIDAATHRIMKSKLTITVAATSPTGALIPGRRSLAAEFAFTADINGDIDLGVTANELLSLQFDTVLTNAVANDDHIALVRWSTGVPLDGALINTNYGGGANEDFIAGSNTAQVDFNFTGAFDYDIVVDDDQAPSPLIITAGTTEIVQVFVDTQDFTVSGNSIRVWIDATAADVDYATEGLDNSIALGAIVARGGIRANVLVKP